MHDHPAVMERALVRLLRSHALRASRASGSALVQVRGDDPGSLCGSDDFLLGGDM